MWDETYNTDTYVYGKSPNGFLVEQAECLPKGKVLCLADGEGRNSVYLASLGYQVTAVDLSLVGLNKARDLAKEEAVEIEFIHADLADFDLGTQQWEAIVSIFCHLPSHIRQPLNQKIVNALKPDGIYLVEGYTHQQLNYNTGGPKDEDMMLSAGILSNELSELSPMFIEEKERHIIEGVKHTGSGHVVQAVFKKRSL